MADQEGQHATELLGNTDFNEHHKFLKLLIKNRGKDSTIWIFFSDHEKHSDKVI